jgi:hypothetical protein
MVTLLRIVWRVGNPALPSTSCKLRYSVGTVSGWKHIEEVQAKSAMLETVVARKRPLYVLLETWSGLDLISKRSEK